MRNHIIKKQPKTESSSKISVKDLDLQPSIKAFLKAMGEDPERAGLKDTPKRAEQALKYLLSGYDRTFEDESTSFENHVEYKGVIFLKNIDFFSLCEHHLLPFFGYAHVAYLPSEKSYLGISKLARAVDIYARRLQNQEVLSHQIAEAIMEHGMAKGVAVLIEARHLCTVARGVQKKAPLMSTCAYYGAFEDNVALQHDFLELLRNRDKV
ncbi:MAG TPA: GTP cyclohydrolase I FolE [Candidatus Saccharimonadales bacterium]|nr:GTP cyclohydrolase I FolE [Candidatus Saccharimonadales bacterium]